MGSDVYDVTSCHGFRSLWTHQTRKDLCSTTANHHFSSDKQINSLNTEGYNMARI